MNEETATTATEIAPETEATELAMPLPDSLDLVTLQKLPPAEIEALCQKYDVRIHQGRSRHHQILDLVRWALGRGVTVTTHGFFDLVADSFAVLRCPALNFLPVPEDVGVSRALTQQYRFRIGQSIAGTVRLPRDREKLLMLDQVTAIEGQPAEQWQEPTAFDSLPPLYP